MTNLLHDDLALLKFGRFVKRHFFAPHKSFMKMTLQSKRPVADGALQTGGVKYVCLLLNCPGEGVVASNRAYEELNRGRSRE